MDKLKSLIIFLRSDHRCVNFVLPQTRREIEWKFERERKAISLPIDSYLQFDYAEALLMAACQGAGIIQAPKYIVAGAIVAFIGVTLTIVLQPARATTMSASGFQFGLGELLTALGAIAVAIATIIGKKWLSQVS
jgi:DNA-binding transcriptional LysR family regulator